MFLFWFSYICHHRLVKHRIQYFLSLQSLLFFNIFVIIFHRLYGKTLTYWFYLQLLNVLTYPLILGIIKTNGVIAVKARVGFASEVDSGQLRNPVLAPDLKLGPSWLHFYHASKVDSREYSLCPVMKEKRVFKISDMVKFTLLNTIITCHKLIFLKFFLWYETVTLSSLSRIWENSRSNLNSKLAFSMNPVHWVVKYLEHLEQLFLGIPLRGYYCPEKRITSVLSLALAKVVFGKISFSQ